MACQLSDLHVLSVLSLRMWVKHWVYRITKEFEWSVSCLVQSKHVTLATAALVVPHPLPSTWMFSKYLKPEVRFWWVREWGVEIGEMEVLVLREGIRVWGTEQGPWERSKAKLCCKVQGQRISLQGQWKVTAVHSIGVVGSQPLARLCFQRER